jgi:hypothetical protein
MEQQVWSRQRARRSTLRPRVAATTKSDGMWLFWVLPNARSVARLGQLDSSPSVLPPVETLEGVPPTQGRADQAWDSPSVGAHDGLECERAMEDQSYPRRTHGAQQSLL